MNTPASSSAPARGRAQRRVFLLATFLAIAALFLSACSAQVNSVISLDPELSGTRTITATLEKSDSDGDYISGGFEAVEATAKEHVPEGLTYEGLEDDGTHVTMTFTLAFDSVDDYRSTVTSLLADEEYGFEPEITIAVPDSPLVSGIEVEENFSSSDLLEWLAAALVEDGVVDESNRYSILEAGESTVDFDGTSYEAGSGNAVVSEVQDYGFARIDAVTTLNDDGSYEQFLTFVQDTELTDDVKAAVSAFFDSTGLADQVTDQSVGGYQGGEWNITHQADNVEDLNAFTSKFLGGPAELTVETAPEEDNPTTFRTVVDGAYDCSAVCSPSGEGLNHTMHFPSNWAVQDAADGLLGVDQSEAFLEARFRSLVVTHSVPLASVHVATDIGLNQSVKQTFTFGASTANVQQVGDAFEKLLRPADGIGSFSVSESDEETVYTTVVESGSTEEHNDKLGQYISGAAVEIYLPEGVAFWPDYQVELYLPLEETLLQSGTESASSTLALPMFHTLSSAIDASGNMVGGDGQLTVEGLSESSSVTAYATGPTLAFWVFWAVIALVVLLAVVAAVVFRRQLAGWWTKAWAQRHAVAQVVRQASNTVRDQGSAALGSASAMAAASAARPDHAATSPAANQGLGPAERHSADFVESQLH